MKFAVLAGITLFAMLVAPTVYDQLTAEATVVICHVPPGDPADAETKTVGAAAAEAHLSNHAQDSLGQCRACDDVALETCRPANCTLDQCLENPGDPTLFYECEIPAECGQLLSCLDANGVGLGQFNCDTGPV